MEAIDIQSRLGAIGLIQAKGDKRIHNALDLCLFDGFAIALLLNDFQNCNHDLVMDLCEEDFPPLDQVQCIHIIDILFAFIDFPPYPMTVQVTEQMIYVLRGCGIAVPFSDIVGKQCFIDVALRVLVELLEVAFKVFLEVLVKVFTK